MKLLHSIILTFSIVSLSSSWVRAQEQNSASSADQQQDNQSQSDQDSGSGSQAPTDAMSIPETGQFMRERAQIAVEKLGKKENAPEFKMAYKMHPWQKSGRKPQDSFKDWKGDSLATMGAEEKEFQKYQPSDLKEKGIRKIEDSQGNNFHECFEPRLDMEEWDEKGTEYDEKGNPIDTEKIYGKKGTPRNPYCWPKTLRPEKKEDGTCPVRTNHGEVWEYWWPEYEIEVNDFGIAAINPKQEFERKELLHKELNKAKNKHYKQLYKQNIKLMNKTWEMETQIAKNLKAKMLPGESQTGGLEVNDQYQTFEAHGYKSLVQTKNHSFPDVRKQHGESKNIYFPTSKDPCTPYPFWYNGYIYKNNYACFDDTLPNRILKKKGPNDDKEEAKDLDRGQSGEQKNKERDNKPKWVAAWTEEFPRIAPYWRYEEFAQRLNKELYEAMNPCAGQNKKLCLGSGGAAGGNGGAKNLNTAADSNIQNKALYDVDAGKGELQLLETQVQDLLQLPEYAPGLDGATPQGNQQQQNDWFNICSWCRNEHFKESVFALPELLKGFATIEPEKKDIACRLCYYGGSSGWPPNGTLMGHHDLTTGPALIARRYAKLIQELRVKKILKDADFPGFTDFQGKKPEEPDKYIDKLQMVYPRVSRCFRMNPSEKDYEEKKPFGQKSKEPNQEKQVPFVWEFALDKQAINKEFPPDLVAPNQLGSLRFALWNRRTAGTCQFRSIVENNGLKKGEEKEEGEKKKVRNFNGKPNKLIEAVRKELPNEEKFYTGDSPNKLKRTIGKAKDQGWGCQAYDGFKYSKKKKGEKEKRIKDRGQGNQKPEDKLFGTKAFGYDKDNAYACSAYQIYPFKQFIDEEVQKKLRECRKLFNPPKDSQEDEKKWDELVKKELEEEQRQMNAPEQPEPPEAPEPPEQEEPNEP
ncbi:MAG: hypothetical protein IT292_05670 [Deltaproteobacteria bacterium]|nr:hypothetical protein [Deltaproteobacteria bacterium]